MREAKEFWKRHGTRESYEEERSVSQMIICIIVKKRQDAMNDQHPVFYI